MFQKINIFLVFIFLFFSQNNGTAQDYQFSQFGLAPLYVSPALTGYMTAQNRIAIKYRSQWSSVLQENEFETILVSYDGRLCPREGVSFAYGFNLVKDQIGFPAFKTNHYMGSIAFHVKLNSGLFASGGLQAGLLQYRLDVSNLNFENQFDQAFDFTSTLPSMEAFLDRDQVNLLDLSGGVMLYSGSSNPWNFGVAFHHVNPKNFYAFTTNGVQDNNRTKVRWNIHGAFTKKINRNYLTFKKMTVIQLPHWQTNIGLDFRLQISKGQPNAVFNSIIFGPALRLSNRANKFLVADAFILSGKTDIATGLVLGLGYDFNISPLRVASNTRGGVEVSLVWEFPIEERSKCVICPDHNSSTFGQGEWQMR